jgi:hypothetical protein
MVNISGEAGGETFAGFAGFALRLEAEAAVEMISLLGIAGCVMLIVSFTYIPLGKNTRVILPKKN